MEYLAHATKNKPVISDSVGEHLKRVAERAKQFGNEFNAGNEAYIAGLLHDLGKYGDLFQKRLIGEESGIDHWSAGAFKALELFKLKGIASALAIQGHHIGLQEASRNSLKMLHPQKLMKSHPLNLKLSENNIDNLLKRLRNENILIPEEKYIANSIYEWGNNTASTMLDLRMLFSVLVDADFIETEAWFNADSQGNRRYREQGLNLEPQKTLLILMNYIENLSHKIFAAPEILKMRRELLQNCLNSAEKSVGLFTLTAPTGSGKTLSMLAFALAHAQKNDLKRIILVIPYLTIIEQTATTFRNIFKSFTNNTKLNKYILEDHSLSGIKLIDSTEQIEDEDYQRQTLTNNWDAPIIITTNVQFFESLFSNRPSACRKLHRLANSVILFDEVQSIPTKLAIPTLATLSHLSERYNSTIVFATATQPAFNHLDKLVKKDCKNGWTPHEIVNDKFNFSISSKRNVINWTKMDEFTTWEQLADKLYNYKQVLCIVNMKRHAKVLFEILKPKGNTNIFHLSTNMCPAHRHDILQKIYRLLRDNMNCLLISTQCIEAGVDIDFPVVYRAMGPLDAIAQAAGRCNRNGNLIKGEVYIFNPPKEEGTRLFPDYSYEQATDTTFSLLKQLNYVDINNPVIFQQYFQRLYLIKGIGKEDENTDLLLNSIRRHDFKEVSKHYQIIPNDTINVLVPYVHDIFHKLREEALNKYINRNWIIRARPYTVGLYRVKDNNNPLYLNLEPIKYKFEKTAQINDWYIYRKEEDYDKDIGLNPSSVTDLLIA